MGRVREAKLSRAGPEGPACSWLRVGIKGNRRGEGVHATTRCESRMALSLLPPPSPLAAASLRNQPDGYVEPDYKKIAEDKQRETYANMPKR